MIDVEKEYERLCALAQGDRYTFKVELRKVLKLPPLPVPMPLKQRIYKIIMVGEGRLLDDIIWRENGRWYWRQADTNTVVRGSSPYTGYNDEICEKYGDNARVAKYPSHWATSLLKKEK